MPGREDVADDAGVGDAERQAPERTVMHAAAVKLPSFYPSAPMFWFSQAESQFRLKKIESDLTKVDHVMASLSEEVALRVMPSIEDQSYTALKAVGSF